jgi:hypothetical protein
MALDATQYERKDVAAVRHQAIEQTLSSISVKLERMDERQRHFETETTERLAAMSERLDGVKQQQRALAPLGTGAAGGGIIAAIVELLKRVFTT